MKSPQFSAPSAELDARVTRFGLRVAASLTERNNDLTHDVSERLRFAREQALARAAQARAASTVAVSSAGPAVVTMDSTLALNGGPRGTESSNGLWAKLASALPLILLLAGLLLMQRGQVNEQIAAAAEVDTALLSDNLPPDAFSDPGFAEFLRDGEE
jgi:uncharacterized iron-regulated membrane protein